MKSHPYSIPFTFTNMPAGAVVTLQHQSIYDFRIMALTADPDQLGVAPYRISIFDNRNFWKLSDDFISNGCFETDAQCKFLFPSAVTIKKATTIYCRFWNIGGGQIGTQICLHGRAYPQGYSEEPTKLPFIYSFYFNLRGAPATNLLGGISYNANPAFGCAQPIDADFELTALTIDDNTEHVNNAGYYRLQVIDLRTKAMLYRTPLISISGAGDRATSTFTATGIAVPGGFPVNNVIQHKLDAPMVFKKGTILGVRAYQSFVYTPDTDLIGGHLDQEINICLIGNRIIS